MTTVPNNFPKYTNQPYRIAFVGEAPGEDEVREGRPFVGFSGRLLWEEASKVGIVRDACFVGNICQHHPPKNKLTAFSWTGPEITGGIAQLEHDLKIYDPHLVVLLGNAPLKWAGKVSKLAGITLWRGSCFLAKGYKCLATLHPANILREYHNKPLLYFDLKRARLEGTTKTLTLPERFLETHLTPDDIICRLDYYRQNHTTLSIDIEGYVDGMSCISIADSSTHSFIIPFTNRWEAHDEQRVLLSLAQCLGDPLVPKILQNALYDTFVLQYGYNIPVRGVIDDTMLMHWERYCEMDKNLAFQASIYTREPYWKDERDNIDQITRWEYCCKDSAVTYEIRNVLIKQLTGRSLDHYRLNMDMLEPTLYQEIKGINYDKTKAQKKLKTIYAQINRLQWTLNQIAGIKNPTTIAGWVEICRDEMCFKRESAFVVNLDSILGHAKTVGLHNTVHAVEILRLGTLSLGDLGELSILTKTALNVDSKDQIADFLYRQLGLPIQYAKESGRIKRDSSGNPIETTDVLALLTLYGLTKDPTLKLILRIRALRTRCESLEATVDPDGRIRCGYNLVGTVTGRLSCYESPTGSGFNLQTATKKDRDLFLSDNGYWFFQCDLSGADGWTVAAHCKAVGDPTMLEDYLYGLKPAKILSLISMFGRQVLSWSREKIKHESKNINQDDWMYFARKRIQHGTNYGMKETTMSSQILKDSYKLFGEPVVVTPTQCATEQMFYNLRYPGLVLWHRWVKQQLKSFGYITDASGHRRDFFGRKDDYNTFKDACAEEPQHNTTYATKLAVRKLWSDIENRQTVNQIKQQTFTSPTSIEIEPVNNRILLRIQPLHTVHDALCGQFPKDCTEWAITKIKSYFNNPLTIAGQSITIPFEGAYGPSWGELGEKYGGGNI